MRIAHTCREARTPQKLREQDVLQAPVTRITFEKRVTRDPRDSVTSSCVGEN